MKQRQHIFQSWAIEVITVLLASTISFPVSDALGVRLSILPFVMVCCSKTHLPFMYLSVGTYNIPCFFILPQTCAIRQTN
mgnify:CR=1 FL=1